MTPEIAEHFAKLADSEYPLFFGEDGLCKRCAHRYGDNGVTQWGLSCQGNDGASHCECRCHVLLARKTYRKGSLDDSYYPNRELSSKLTEALAEIRVLRARGEKP